MLWLLAAAAAQECDAAGLAPVADTLSVAWVSKVRRSVGAGAWLWVVPTAELRSYTADASLGRTLQWLGERRRAKDPRGRYKVVVFDTGRDQLCRPLAGEAVGGVAPCDDRRTPDPSAAQACGRSVDRATGQPAATLFRAEWATLAQSGFCVLPYERFSAGR